MTSPDSQYFSFNGKKYLETSGYSQKEMQDCFYYVQGDYELLEDNPLFMDVFTDMTRDFESFKREMLKKWLGEDYDDTNNDLLYLWETINENYRVFTDNDVDKVCDFFIGKPENDEDEIAINELKILLKNTPRNFKEFRNRMKDWYGEDIDDEDIVKEVESAWEHLK